MADFPHHSGGVIRVHYDGRWGSVPEALLEDKRLSLDARAVACWLAIKSNDWKICISHLRRNLELKETRWLRIAKEMEAAGYFLRRKWQGGDGKWIWEIVFTPVPTIPGFSGHGSAIPGSAMPGQTGNNRKTNKTNTNKTNTKKPPPLLKQFERGKKENPQVVQDVGADEEVREEPRLIIEPIAVLYKKTLETLAMGLPQEKSQLLADELAGRLSQSGDQLRNVSGWLKWKLDNLFEPSPAAFAIAKARELRHSNEVAAKAAAIAPQDDEAKKRGAILLQRMAPSFAAHVNLI